MSDKQLVESGDTSAPDLRTPEELDADYPGTALAYEHIGDAYEGPRSRMDRMEDRFGALVSLAATVTVAVPTLLKGLNVSPDFLDWRFLAAMATGAITVALGVWHRNRGTLRVINPGRLYEKYLHLSPGEFQRRMVYWAGEHWALNIRSVEKQGQILDRLTVAFMVELALFIWWIFS